MRTGRRFRWLASSTDNRRAIDMSVVQFPLDRLPQAGPIIISQSETSILVAIEVSRATLARNRRCLQMLLAPAVEPVSIEINMSHRHIEIPNDRDDRLTQLRES